MAALRFDAFGHDASEVLNVGYAQSGYVLQTKKSTRWGGSIVETQVSCFDGTKKCATPATLSWRLPKPFGFSFVDIDKLELDRAGKCKLDASFANACGVPGLKVDVRFPVEDLSKAAIGCTYANLRPFLFRLDCPARSPGSFRGEVTCAPVRGAHLGAKFTSEGGIPDLALRLSSGRLAIILGARVSQGALGTSAFLRVSPHFRYAASLGFSATHGLSSTTLGMVYKNVYRVKVAHSTREVDIAGSVLFPVSKGISLLGGVRYGVKQGHLSWGLALKLE